MFLFWSVQDRTLPIYPIVFRQPGLPVGGKHMQLIAAMEASEQTQHLSKNLYEREHIKYQLIINQ